MKLNSRCARPCAKTHPVCRRLWARRIELAAGKGKTVMVTCIVALEIGSPIGLNRSNDTCCQTGQRPVRRRSSNWSTGIGPLGHRNAVKCAQEGCKVEELQLGTIDRIERALALYLVVVWSIAFLMRMGRTCSDLDAKLLFDPTKFRPPICSISNWPLPLRDLVSLIIPLGSCS